MKKIKFLPTSILFFATFSFVMTSCEEERFLRYENDGIDHVARANDLNMVSLEMARSIAESIFRNSGKRTYHKEGIKKHIESIAQIGTDAVYPSYYIINYRDGGFLILSADKRTYPVLAFSESDNFDIDGSAYPNLLVEWLKVQDCHIQEVRKDTTLDRSAVHELWKMEKIENFISPTTGMESTISLSSFNSFDSLSCAQPELVATHDDHLLSTSHSNHGAGLYHGFSGYACSLKSHVGAPTGYTTESKSDSIGRHGYPVLYNWQPMQYMLTFNGEHDIRWPMGNDFNFYRLNSGRDFLGPDTYSVPEARPYNLLVSNPNHTDFQISTDSNGLIKGYPLVVGKAKKSFTWLMFNPSDKHQHTGLCDGMKYYRSKIRIRTGPKKYSTLCVSQYAYHINWGWKGSYNGWYSSLGFPSLPFHYKPNAEIHKTGI